MRHVALVLALAASVGCGTTGRRWVNGTALAVSSASLAVDGYMTYVAAADGWRGGHGIRAEANPIMGPHPSPELVVAYFTTALVWNAAAWIITPPRYRAALPLAVTALEVNTMVGNVRANGFLGSVGLAPALGSEGARR